MLPSFPASTPSFSSVTTDSVPSSSDYNPMARELEAIVQALGKNPYTIDDTVEPKPSPRTVGEFFDMLAYIFKKQAGVTNWYDAALADQEYIHGHGNAGTIASSDTGYGYFFGGGIAASTDEDKTRAYLNYDSDLFRSRVTRIAAEILTAQPGTGSLVFTLRVNGANTALTFTIAAGAAAFTLGSDTDAIAVSSTDYITIGIVNNASSASAQIGAITLTVEQTT